MKKLRMRKILFLLVVSSVVLLGGAGRSTQPCLAQFGGGLGFGQLELIRQMKGAQAALISYRQEYGHLPQQTPELDQALKMAFRRVSLSSADPTITAQSQGIYRTYYQFAITYDPTGLNGLSVVNGKIDVPSNWSAPCNTVVMISDGADKFAVWGAGTDQRPVNDPTTGNPAVILETVHSPAAQPTQ
jgi:hypothetical protein